MFILQSLKITYFKIYDVRPKLDRGKPLVGAHSTGVTCLQEAVTSLRLLSTVIERKYTFVEIMQRGGQN